MGISGKATGGGGAVWPRLEIVKQTIRIAQLGGPLRLRLGSDASPNGDGGTGNGAALVPRVASPGYHPFRVAIDASIWIYQTARSLESHAIASRSFSANSFEERYGKNQPLRTLFYRLCRLLRSGLFPVFVFDNPDPRSRPVYKHGGHHSLGKEVLAMQDRFKTMVSLFGMPYIISRSEAEAECAELTRRGLVDAVMSEDIDTLLFGGTSIIRGWTAGSGTPSSSAPSMSQKVAIVDDEPLNAPSSSAQFSHKSAASSKSTSSPNATLDLFSADLIASHPNIRLSRNSLILFALLNGSDYTPGIDQLGAMTAYELVRDDPTSLGRALIAAIIQPFLDDPTKDKFTKEERAAIHATLREHLTSNPRKLLSRKKPSAANNIPADFPPEGVIKAYLRPTVYETYPQQLLDRLADPFRDAVDWNGLQKLAEDDFGWGVRKLDDKFAKTVAEAVAFWEVRKAADRTVRFAREQQSLLLDNDHIGKSASQASTESGRGQPAITDYFAQVKKRPMSEVGGSKSIPASQSSVESLSGIATSHPSTLSNPILSIVSIKKARDSGDESTTDGTLEDLSYSKDAGMECKVRVKLVSTPMTSTTQQHPFTDEIEIRVPLALARAAAPRLVREFESTRTPKPKPKREADSQSAPAAPRKKKKGKDLDIVDLVTSDSEDAELAPSSPVASAKRRPDVGRTKVAASMNATAKRSFATAASLLSEANILNVKISRPINDDAENPFLEERVNRGKERLYKPLPWKELWESPASFGRK